MNSYKVITMYKNWEGVPLEEVGVCAAVPKTKSADEKRSPTHRSGLVGFYSL